AGNVRLARGRHGRIHTALEQIGATADKEAMDYAGFPWRQLGTLLVDEGLLTQPQLEVAVVEQRRTGRLLGQILVDFGYVSGFELGRALAAPHGVEVRPTADGAARGARDPSSHADGEPSDRWRPLGKPLV